MGSLIDGLAGHAGRHFWQCHRLTPCPSDAVYCAQPLVTEKVWPVRRVAGRPDMRYRQGRLSAVLSADGWHDAAYNAGIRAIAEIGRQARLRIWWRKPCGFESRIAHLDATTARTRAASSLGIVCCAGAGGSFKAPARALLCERTVRAVSARLPILPPALLAPWRYNRAFMPRHPGTTGARSDVLSDVWRHHLEGNG